MPDTVKSLVAAALSSISQNKVFPADIAYAKRCLTDAIGQLTPVSENTCPECGGDGADHEDSSKNCFECCGTGKCI